MTYKLEYSQIVRRKMKTLKNYLTAEYGTKTATETLKKITSAARGLQKYPSKGIALSSLFDVDTDFNYIFVAHNYLFYYIEGDTIYIAEMFHEREDFMYHLFCIPSHTKGSEDYWGE